MQTTPRCSDFVVEQGRANEYRRAKAILNHGKHPTFIGRSLYATCARNGGVCFFRVGSTDAAVAMIGMRTNCLLVLCVEPHFRRLGLGAAALAYLQCSFARVVESAVPWFERQGFIAIGEMKQGKSLKTQIMVLSSLRDLAGRVSRLLTP